MPLYTISSATPGGAANTVQFNSAGVFGGITGSSVSGSVLTLNPALVIGGNATSPYLYESTAGTAAITIGDKTTPANSYVIFGQDISAGAGVIGLGLTSGGVLCWASTTAAAGNNKDTFIGRSAAATIQFGRADVNGAAVAQITQVQSAVTGTDQNGANWTFIGSKQTGAGTPGNIIFQTSIKLASSTTQGTPETGLTITGPNATGQHPSVVCGNQAIATNASDGFLYIASGAGPPTGTPTTFTGRVPLYYDSTNDQLYIFRASWKQPKTPAAAAIVTWQ